MYEVYCSKAHADMSLVEPHILRRADVDMRVVLAPVVGCMGMEEASDLEWV